MSIPKHKSPLEPGCRHWEWLSAVREGVWGSVQNTLHMVGQSSMSLPSARAPNPQTQAAKQQVSSDPSKMICGEPTEDLLSAKCFCEVWKASELNKEHQVRATASLQSPPFLCRGFPCTAEPGEQHSSQ